jgi:hypothetical protein
MKTTVVISDALLKEAEKVVLREKTTLKALINEGLAEALEKRRRRQKHPTLQDHSFGGDGLQPEFAHLGLNDIITKLRDSDV